MRLAAAALGFLLPVLASAAARPPNLLVILSDDQGWGDLSLHGNTNLATPRLDSLARDGVAFDRFYVSPVCSPTRAEFLTGRWHPRGGVVGVSTGGERLDLDERTLADALRPAGYTTGCFGKWHNGTQGPYHPLRRGFDEFYGFTSGHWGDYFDAPLDLNGQPVAGKGYLPDDLTDHALEFITRHRERPFFCFVPYNTPHSPMQVPDAYWDRFKDKPLALRGGAREDINHTRAALAMVENLDWNVGRLLDALDRLGLARDTLVVFFCDNGPNGARWNGGMKGVKGTLDEGGVRSPCLMRWTGTLPAGFRQPSIAGAVDLLPTLLGLAGISHTPALPLDGLDLSAALRAGRPGPVDRLIFSHWAGKVSVRSPTHRLDAAGALFDMVADPGQTRDVAVQQPETAARLRDARARWKNEVGLGAPAPERPCPVGDPALPLTVLPARDGVPAGGVRRSARAPNCSYFTGWTTPEGRIAWPVEILTAGRYRAEALYACPAADVGAEVELTGPGGATRATVDRPHDPPARGMEHDRVPRDSESYVKDFAPLPLGELTLEKGRGNLVLRALRVPGGQVMELRALHLERLEAR